MKIEGNVPMNLFDLTGKVAFVTGASGGLGLHFAQVLHAAGASVTLAARSIGRANAEIDAMGERGFGTVLDVTDEASITAALDAAAAKFGPADILINNAGVAVTQPFLKHTGAEWDSVVDVNLRGAFQVGREAAKRMVEAKRGGSIVNIASILGERVAGGLSSYAASKAGLIQLTRSMAIELARYDIRVNALAPGYIVTDINEAHFNSDAGQAMIKRIPQRRIGTMGDLDGPLLLLASATAGAHMTGSVITVDGGHSVNSL